MPPIKIKDAEAVIDPAAVLSLQLAFISDWAFPTLLTPLGLLASAQKEERESKLVKSLLSHPRVVTARE